MIKARHPTKDINLAHPEHTPQERSAIKQAIDVLHQAQGEMESAPSWRLFYLLYRLYAAHPKFTYDFAKKLALMTRLEHTDFKWYIRMRFEHAVLCYQNDEFSEGQRRFKQIRALLRQPDQVARRLYDFWRWKDNPEVPRVATITVRRIDSDWRGYGFIEEMGQEVLFRPRHFEVPPRIGEYRACVVRFETMGPIAAPKGFSVQA